MNSFLGSLTKYGLIFFNFICLIFGLLLIIFGALARSSDYGEITKIGSGPANLSICIGVAVFFICFLGCCGAVKENRCMLVTFGSVIFILVIVEFAVGGLAYKYRDELVNISQKGLNETLEKYHTPGNDGLTQNIDALQTNLKCCGVNGPDDWMKYSGRTEIPNSCCEDQRTQCIHPFHKGCAGAIAESLAPALNVLAITVLAFAIIQTLGIICSCCIASCIKRAQYNHV